MAKRFGLPTTSTKCVNGEYYSRSHRCTKTRPCLPIPHAMSTAQPTTTNLSQESYSSRLRAGAPNLAYQRELHHQQYYINRK